MSTLHEDASSNSFFNGHPKTMFFFGLFVGIASVTSLVLILTLSWFLSGKGAMASGDTTGQLVQQVPSAPTPPVEQPQAPSAPVKPVDEKVDHIRGKKDAKITLIEYSDFECPFCLRHVATVEQVLKDYPNDVRLVYRHFPLSFHPQAQKAAEASECAGNQGKFWEMHDEIFKANAAGTMSVAKWKEIAGALKLDTNKFNTCLDSGEMAGRVNQDLAEGSQAGVGGTPGTFVNGELVEGAVPYATFKQIIEQKLKG